MDVNVELCEAYESDNDDCDGSDNESNSEPIHYEAQIGRASCSHPTHSLLAHVLQTWQ